MTGMHSSLSKSHENGTDAAAIEMDSPSRETVPDKSPGATGEPRPPEGLSDGEALRFGTGTMSAPPPGFGEGPGERTRRATSQLLWSVPDDGPVVASEDADSSGWYKQSNQHTTSYTNLVAVLGSGMAESIDDSTRYQDSGDLVDAARGLDLAGPGLDLSLARQSRHAASRLIGTSGNSPNRAVTAGVAYRVGSPPITMPKPVRKASTPEPSLSFLSSSSFDNIPEGQQLPQNSQRPFTLGPEIHRQSTPLGMFSPGNPRALPTKDIGVTVMEPCTSAPPNLFEGILSTQSSSNRSRSSNELEHDMQGLVIDEHRRSPFAPPSTSPTADLSMSQHRSEIELHHFVWDVRGTEPSRALVILRASNLHIPDVRSTCEAFGVLATFRSDFSDRGIIFVGYYDIRSAQYAALELEACLKRLAMSERGDSDVRVQYCVPLNSSSAHDESVIVINDVPPGVSENSMTSILSSYGSIRSLKRQGESQFSKSSYVVEFHNEQDAKQALMELESTQPWGSDVLIEEGVRSPAKRKRGRELLGLIGRWRQGNAQTVRVTPPISSSSSGGARPTSSTPPVPPGSSNSSSPKMSAPETAVSYAQSVAPAARQDYGEAASLARPQQPQSAQLLVAPDGSYSYVMVNHAAYQTAPHHHQDSRGMNVPEPPPAPQHVVHSPPGSYSEYLTSIPSSSSHYSSSTSAPSHSHPVHYWQHGTPQPLSAHQYHPPHMHGGNVVQQPHQYRDSHPPPPHYPPGNSPYYQQLPHSHADSSLSSGGGSASQQQHVVISSPPRRPTMSSPVDDREARHLMLGINSVESGRDTRTSLMVRNIPNKYTQQMLLSEFTENGHGPGKIDFFYLPIDFKNRCNRGYAFINFVDYRDIVPFHRQYYGQHWKNFNSDKICDITYARIQGKTGMLKRFENSALMEKDDEYKPLVFVSHGADKGRRLPFP
jgi:RNA recognition motif-containing protein